ncbi:hypothetical protein FPV67DRAFT_1473884 [Lyophyllum atratum]|nr:hypothetical protein FPV67DRAFT_1473884 [Lyophyllum atratum]
MLVRNRRSCITAFQARLIQPAHPDGIRKVPIRGLDKSIVIDVMWFISRWALCCFNALPPRTPHPSASPAPTFPPLAGHQIPLQPCCTVATTLALLRSLGPRIDAILTGGLQRPSPPANTTATASELASNSNHRSLHTQRSSLRCQAADPTMHNPL